MSPEADVAMTCSMDMKRIKKCIASAALLALVWLVRCTEPEHPGTLLGTVKWSPKYEAAYVPYVSVPPESVAVGSMIDSIKALTAGKSFKLVNFEYQDGIRFILYDAMRDIVEGYKTPAIVPKGVTPSVRDYARVKRSWESTGNALSPDGRFFAYQQSLGPNSNILAVPLQPSGGWVHPMSSLENANEGINVYLPQWIYRDSRWMLGGHFYNWPKARPFDGDHINSENSYTKVAYVVTSSFSSKDNIILPVQPLFNGWPLYLMDPDPNSGEVRLLRSDTLQNGYTGNASLGLSSDMAWWFNAHEGLGHVDSPGQVKFFNSIIPAGWTGSLYPHLPQKGLKQSDVLAWHPNGMTQVSTGKDIFWNLRLYDKQGNIKWEWTPPQKYTGVVKAYWTASPDYVVAIAGKEFIKRIHYLIRLDMGDSPPAYKAILYEDFRLKKPFFLWVAS